MKLSKSGAWALYWKLCIQNQRQVGRFYGHFNRQICKPLNHQVFWRLYDPLYTQLWEALYETE